MNNILQETINLDDIFNDDKIIDGKIYKITNLINGKIYIGQTIRSVSTRWKAHVYNALKSDNKYPLYNSIKLRGAENFTVEQVDSARTYTELNKKEYEWVIKENCLAPNGYNLRAGGYGKGVSETTRKKMSIKKLGITPHNKNLVRYYNNKTESYKYCIADIDIPEGYERCVYPKTTKYHNPDTDETIELYKDDDIPIGFIYGSGIKEWYFDTLNNKYVKILKSELNIPEHFEKGFNPLTCEETIIKRSKSLTGHIVTEETRRKISEAQIGKIISEETKLKLSISHIGRKHSEEQKIKISQSHIGLLKGTKHFYNPETLEHKMLHPYEEIPEGFIQGSPKGKNKGNRYFYNPETLESIMINSINCSIPEGFIPGRKPKTTI